MIEIKLEFPNLAKKLKAHVSEIVLFVAANMQTNRAMLFDQEGAYNGHKKWPGLKLRQGKPLMDTGTLKRSIAPQNDGSHPKASQDGIIRITGEYITIGTKLAYARLMNDGTTKMPGGVMRPVNAKALKIPIPEGKNASPGAKKIKDGVVRQDNQKFMFRKSVKIPERRFDEWNAQDRAEMSAALANKIAKVLNG